MSHNFDGCEFEDNGTGIRVEGDVELNVKNSKFRRNNIAVDIHRPDLMRKVGLPENTPFDLVKELSEAIVKAQAISAEEQLNVAKKSRLTDWLKNTGHVVKTAKDLVDIGIKIAGLLG